MDGDSTDKQSRPVHFQDVRVGMFFSDTDFNIATRIKRKIEELGCNIELCDFYDGGVSKLQDVEDFLSSKNTIFWLATETSIVKDDFMKKMQHFGLYKAIEDKKFRFVVLQPQECPKLKLPTILSAYTSLLEDDSFQERLTRTLQSVAKKISRQPGTTTTNHKAANVDTVEGVEYGFEQGIGDCAEPIPGVVAENQLEGAPDSGTTIYNITIQGDNNQIQVGSGNQMGNDPDAP